MSPQAIAPLFYRRAAYCNGVSVRHIASSLTWPTLGLRGHYKYYKYVRLLSIGKYIVQVLLYYIHVNGYDGPGMPSSPLAAQALYHTCTSRYPYRGLSFGSVRDHVNPEIASTQHGRSLRNKYLPTTYINDV